MKQIIVPTDFSDHALTASRLALTIGRAHGAGVTLLHVDHLPGSNSPGAPPPAIGQAAWDRFASARTRAIEELLGTLRDALDGDDLHTKVVCDEISTAVINHARESECDLVVMGTHGVGSGEAFLLGSVAAAMSATAPCPVLVTRSGHVERTPQSGRFRRVVFAVDHSRQLAAATPMVRSLLDPEAAVDLAPVWPGAATDDPDRVAHLLAEFGERHFEGMEAAGSPARRRPAGVLLGMLERGGNDLAVLGARAGEPDQELRSLGAVADRLLHHAPCPVLVVPPPDIPQD